jgi:hypothetical protein
MISPFQYISPLLFHFALHAEICDRADKLNDIRKARVCYCASEPCGFHLRLPFLGMGVCNSDVQSAYIFAL